MKIYKKLESDILNISIEGRLDTNTAPELEKEVEVLNGVRTLILDLKDLDYISSAGLRVILCLYKTMSNQGSIVIRNIKEEVREVFEMTGFTDIIKIE